MTLIDLRKTPFPWMGGKADAAPAVWDALGDCDHYVEPFAGSLAVLMRRPHPCNRTYYSETVNDADGLLCNAWRAIDADPDAVAEAASWPVCEADMHARHLALLRWREERQLEHLMGDPAFHDARMAGWWLWGQCAWIGPGWCSGEGPWVVGADGRIEKRKGARGVSRQLPHVSNNGRGVNTAAVREPGVSRQLPHVSNGGRGINRLRLREPGVGDEPEYHPMTMPELRRWMRFLSARLRHVRILNGDWSRAVTGGVLQNLSVRQGGVCGVFLDPPYGDDVRQAGLYTVDDGALASKVRAWCEENGNNPRYRIVLAGFDTEHASLVGLGWREVEWYRAGHLKGGYGNLGGSGATQMHRDRLWLSPHCLGAKVSAQQSLFA
jgi:hypothetical protein